MKGYGGGGSDGDKSICLGAEMTNVQESIRGKITLTSVSSTAGSGVVGIPSSASKSKEGMETLLRFRTERVFESVVLEGVRFMSDTAHA